jgi:hypothetical protein
MSSRRLYVVLRNESIDAKLTIVLSHLWNPSMMKIMSAIALTGSSHLLRFESLADPGRGYAFPCDASGRVDLDALTDTARCNYLYARAVVGREFHFPQVQTPA